MSDITQIILDLIKEKGISKAHLERECGFSNGTIHNWEKGKNNPSKSAIEKISQYFGVSIEYAVNNKFQDKLIVDMSDAISSVSDKIVAENFKNIIKQLNDEDVPKIIEYMKFLISQRKDEE